jgi:hypothetical protein
VENLKEINYIEDLGVDRRIILKWIMYKQRDSVWTGLIWFRRRSKGNFLEADNILWFYHILGSVGFMTFMGFLKKILCKFRKYSDSLDHAKM